MTAEEQIEKRRLKLTKTTGMDLMIKFNEKIYNTEDFLTHQAVANEMFRRLKEWDDVNLHN